MHPSINLLRVAHGETHTASTAPAPAARHLAFDANDVTKELWDNRQNVAREGAGNYAKFSSPTIANGHVYLPTFSNRVVVYGLR